MEVLEVAKKLEQLIKKSNDIISELPKLAEKCATAECIYEKQLAIIILKLKAGEEVELDGNKVVGVQVSLIEKVARGICAHLKLDYELYDKLHKGKIMELSMIKTQLMALMSINKHLDVNEL